MVSHKDHNGAVGYIALEPEEDSADCQEGSTSAVEHGSFVAGEPVKWVCKH